MQGFHEIHDSYAISVRFPRDYPSAVPNVHETGKRISRDTAFHTYEDGSFCLGSEIKLKAIIFETPKIIDFFNRVVEPFLYSISYKIKYDEFPNGELAHGEAGLVDDYEVFFQVKGKKAVLGVLSALGTRKLVANKLQCPCSCGKRLGKCEFRFKVEKWRKLAQRRWFRDYTIKMFKPLERAKPKKKICN